MPNTVIIKQMILPDNLCEHILEQRRLNPQDRGGKIEFRDGASYWDEQPRAGDFVVFPGTLEHRVHPHSSTEPRISIAFNFKKR